MPLVLHIIVGVAIGIAVGDSLSRIVLALTDAMIARIGGKTRTREHDSNTEESDC